MENIRVGNRVVIGVNDEGETITLNFDDVSFIDRFFDVAESLDKASAEFGDDFEALSERDKVKATTEKMTEITQELDGLFGEGCCRKVFGDIVPSPYLLSDFFEQLLPIIQKHANERQKQIAAKYTKRKGSRKG